MALKLGPLKLAPWTDEEVKSLNEYQACNQFHPFTCCNREPDGAPHVLEATKLGWICPKCPSYHQDYCLDWMADGSWKKSYDPRVEKLLHSIGLIGGSSNEAE